MTRTLTLRWLPEPKKHPNGQVKIRPPGESVRVFAALVRCGDPTCDARYAWIMVDRLATVCEYQVELD